MLANGDVVAVGELPVADRLLLDGCTTRTADRVWTLSTTSLLAAVDSGRPLGAAPCVLDDRAAHALSSTVRTLLDDIAGRPGQGRTWPTSSSVWNRPRPRW